MVRLSIRIPDSLHNQIRKLAEAEGVSINQFIATAVAEKVSALDTLDYLAERAARGDRSLFEAALRRIPDAPPAEEDAL